MPDYSQVSQLFAVYAMTQDERDFATLRSVFTEDCTFSVEIANGPSLGPFEGRDATIEFIEGAISAQTDQRRHVLTNIRLEGNVAYALLSLFVTEHGELAAQSTGVYRCDVVERDGALRFASMHLDLDRGY
jgi:hypothetical protein